MLLETPLCDFDQRAPAFELADPDGVQYELDRLMGKKGLLIAFISNHCPYVKVIIARVVADAKELQEIGVNVVAIMPNDYSTYPDDSPANMKRFAQQHGFTFPYLVDETQAVAKAYDAVCTPDFFGYNANAGLQYRGRIDDGMMEDKVDRNKELLEAMRLVAQTGRGPQQQTPSMGCSIKWKA